MKFFVKSDKIRVKTFGTGFLRGIFMYRVLIADDEALIRMYIREILENNGYEVVGEAGDGLEAVTKCKKHHPDFVIMDINMPIMTGLEAAKIIHEENLANFVIVLTAYRDKKIAQKAVNMDVMGYIVKPVDEDALIPAIQIALNQYQQIEMVKTEFHKTKEALDGRKYVDRAKGMIMEQKQMTEKEAYAYIRKLAMDSESSMAEIAKLLLRVQKE